MSAHGYIVHQLREGHENYDKFTTEAYAAIAYFVRYDVSGSRKRFNILKARCYYEVGNIQPTDDTILPYQTGTQTFRYRLVGLKLPSIDRPRQLIECCFIVGSCPRLDRIIWTSINIPPPDRIT